MITPWMPLNLRKPRLQTRITMTVVGPDGAGNKGEYCNINGVI